MDKKLEVSNTASNSRQNMVIQQQLFTLKTTISQLRNAYNGNDVDWPDQGMLRANRSNYSNLLTNYFNFQRTVTLKVVAAPDLIQTKRVAREWTTMTSQYRPIQIKLRTLFIRMWTLRQQMIIKCCRV